MFFQDRQNVITWKSNTCLFVRCKLHYKVFTLADQFWKFILLNRKFPELFELNERMIGSSKPAMRPCKLYCTYDSHLGSILESPLKSLELLR